ncbi:LPXTG cell wall anchor domain-containing protein [Brevibacterium sp. CBA3109]|uniref:LPXTG cell wall anchor domain-containing protein n=1 Tax=Brevibacterium koreense TaxID=3140787 RepID=A0AAU7UPI5_9MICO
MQKKLVQSSLALTAAAALGLGSAFVASPALADGPQKLDVQNDKQVQKALSDIEGVNAYGEKDGQLNLGVEKKTDKIEDLEKKYDNINVVEGVKELEPYAKMDLVGGAGYLSSQPGGTGVCSTGFSGWDDDGNPVVLTAGHCSKVIDQTSGEIGGDTTVSETEKPSSAKTNGGEGFEPSGNGVIGTWGFHSYGSGDLLEGDDPGAWPAPKDSDIDFAVIDVDADNYNVKNGVTDWTSAGTDDLSTDLATDIAEVGAHKDGKVSKSGRTTGLTEGDVWTEYNEQFEFSNIGGRWVHGFGVLSPNADPFSAPGDSGGAVFQGDTAVGVISGGGPAPASEPGKEFGWVADLDYSIEQSRVDFNVEKPDEGSPGDDDANADADAKDAEADGGADGKDADAAAAADGNDADADAKDADADAAADGKDADAAAAADGNDATADADAKNADADADAPEAPEAPAVDNQKVDEGGQITGKTEANAKVKLTWNPASGTQSAPQVDVPAEGTVTVTADAEGNFTTEAPSKAGEYAYTATATTAAGTSKTTKFTVVVEEAADETDAGADGATAEADAGAESDADGAAADADAGAEADAGASADAKDAESNADSDGSKDGEAPAERKISISPKEVAASDFVKKDKGVTITVKGFDEGENVSLEVVAGPENVEGITLDETANEDGVAAFSIYGTNASAPSAYLGKYDVQVTGDNDTDDEKALAGSFSVVADEDGNGGGSDDGDGGDGGSDLPRTGAELTGLAAGAGLLVVGGAAVVLTMRRNKKN